IGEVGTVERADQLDRIAEPQLGDDVAPHPVGGRRRERVQRNAREVLAQPAELPVLRTEIVPPLTDAVRFVDRDEAHAALLPPPVGSTTTLSRRSRIACIASRCSGLKSENPQTRSSASASKTSWREADIGELGNCVIA